MKVPLFLLAAFCMLISSCQKEGPLGFKTGQTYTVTNGKSSVKDKVVDVGPDWVEFERLSTGDVKRLSTKQLEELLPYFFLE